MKEKDFDKNLNMLLIKGLIKEAEQENIEFEEALKKIDDDEFLQITSSPKHENSPMKEKICESKSLNFAKFVEEDYDDEGDFEEGDYDEDDGDYEESPEGNYSIQYSKPVSVAADKAQVRYKTGMRRRRTFFSFLILALIAVTTFSVVAYNRYSNKLCQNALTLYFDISVSDGRTKQLVHNAQWAKKNLPDLEREYGLYLKKDYFPDSFAEKGWMLSEAYLLLNKRGDAIAILNDILGYCPDSKVSDKARKVLEIID